MKMMKKLAAALVVLTMALSVSALSFAEEAYGSGAVTEGSDWTLEQMLTWAMQDETMAQAEYQAIEGAFGNNPPFANISGAEETHIALLKTLFATYALNLPENTAASRVTVPATLDDAYTAGITAENANIAMYDRFLARTDLPDDVRAAFVALRNASENHLAAYTRNTNRTGMGMRNGWNGNTQDGDANTYGNSNGNGNRGGNNNRINCPLGGTGVNGNGNATNWENCPMYNTEDGTCAGCGTQSRGGRWNSR